MTAVLKLLSRARQLQLVRCRASAHAETFRRVQASHRWSRHLRHPARSRPQEHQVHRALHRVNDSIGSKTGTTDRPAGAPDRQWSTDARLELNECSVENRAYPVGTPTRPTLGRCCSLSAAAASLYRRCGGVARASLRLLAAPRARPVDARLWVRRLGETFYGA